MEKQLNSNVSNVPPNEVSQPSPTTSIVQPTKFNYWIIVSIVLFILLASFSGFYFLSYKNQPQGQPELKITNSPTTVANQINPTASINPSIVDKESPKYLAFMRNGDIWFTDFTGEIAAKDNEVKISKTSKVDSPKLSPNGKNLVYFSIIHDTGGFPTGNVYLTDTQGISEISLGATNNYASRLTWSNDGSTLGLILFSNGATGKTIAAIYDSSAKKKIKEVELNPLKDNQYGQKGLTIDKSYGINLNCSQLESKYTSFCDQFQTVLNTDQTASAPQYKAEEFSKSQYAKPDYKLTESKRLNNGLVLLEFYKGEPQNPESQWGEGGGSFVPGYDKGVTDTYAVLLNENTGKIVKEIPLAINSNFIF